MLLDLKGVVPPLPHLEITRFPQNRGGFALFGYSHVQHVAEGGHLLVPLLGHLEELVAVGQGVRPGGHLGAGHEPVSWGPPPGVQPEAHPRGDRRTPRWSSLCHPRATAEGTEVALQQRGGCGPARGGGVWALCPRLGDPQSFPKSGRSQGYPAGTELRSSRMGRDRPQAAGVPQGTLPAAVPTQGRWHRGSVAVLRG